MQRPLAAERLGEGQGETAVKKRCAHSGWAFQRGGWWEGLHQGWLMLPAGTHWIFIKSPFRKERLHLKSQRMPGGLACVFAFAHMAA